MKLRLLSVLVLSMLITQLKAQDTFSIVAADSSTREVGSAGASCVDLFAAGFSDPSFLGDLLPDTGAINSQAAYVATNQKNARLRMRAGDNPTQIINWLIANDVSSDPTTRQYGIVGFSGPAISSAGYTGADCFDYKNHITGSINGIHYSIQGNILLGQQVLDSMEQRFRTADGDLACRLMAALQGAKIVGADTRCAPNGSSSLFAFVKVAQSTDSYGSPSFAKAVRTRGNAGIEPIDSLQAIVNQVHNCGPAGLTELLSHDELIIFPNPASDELSILIQVDKIGSVFTLMDQSGRTVKRGTLSGVNTAIDLHELSSGVYFIAVDNIYRKVMKN